MMSALRGMTAPLERYARWLHTGWPAGEVERLPVTGEGGTTNVPGLRVVGDLSGIPLLKFAIDGGVKAARAAAAELKGESPPAGNPLDLAIVGGGVAGIAAAIEARNLGLRFAVYEAAEPFSTLANFPKGKAIFTYPAAMRPEGSLQVAAGVKEELLEELETQRRAANVEPVHLRIDRVSRHDGLLRLHPADPGTPPIDARRVIVAIGRSGNFRKLGVPGETSDKVSNRLHDPAEFAGRNVLVVGGGDSALEAAIALATCGARVTVSYRKPEFSRPKPENLEKLRALEADPAAPVGIEHPTSERVTTAVTPAMRPRGTPGSIRLLLGSRVRAIHPGTAEIELAGGNTETLPNDAVFAMIGREAPLPFFRRSGVAIQGEWRPATWAAFAAFFAFCVFIYLWKGGTDLNAAFAAHKWFPHGVTEALRSLAGPVGAAAANPRTLLGTTAITVGEPGFYYSLAYCACVVAFGFRRIRRRKTPYIRAQTLVLMAVQCIPLFALPYFILPGLGHNGAFDAGAGKAVADALFPAAGYGQGREYWRAFGLVLAWPLFIWNVFTDQPMAAWLAISLVQTFVLIPLLVWRFGKGAYCGWICSCGALAETLGDEHRQKMPHGPLWNRLNLVGQAILAVALLLLALRVATWIPGMPGREALAATYQTLLKEGSLLGLKINYYHTVDIFLAGVVGVGLYFWFSGRVWCRFACPLAALMHIYARFSQFRIFADKKKCISCNVCTSVCHQGIDVMNFANKGLPMSDPECVRCSACVQSCPTGVLAFGRLAPGQKITLDRLPASPVQMAESPGPR
jgi:thioredoxin reductase/ferredoxin